MQSPFPGMDPYIEACDLFGDFQFGLIYEINRTICLVLPERYTSRLNSREYIDQDPLPDGTPCECEHREPFIEIREVSPGRPLVTCVEVLSPANKRLGSVGRSLYLLKRRHMLSGNANFVEIDLLRRGQRMPIQTEWPDAPYYILNRRRAGCCVLPAYSLRPLPPVTIPLLKPDGDIELDLNPLVASVADIGRYDMDIDYTKPINPPLGDDERAWLDARLAADSR